MDSDPRRAFQVFSRASELRSAERERYLAETCGGDVALRDEVERLLAIHEEPEEGSPELERRLRAAVAGEMAERLAAEPELPERIDGFRILRCLGAGGMGRVYLAEQEAPRRRVALKILRADTVTPESLQRFELEAQLLARLRHPSIAAIHAAGRFASPLGTLPYLVMEYVDGQPLLEHARTLDTRARLALFARLCDAVQHAHQHGVIHRDLKPGNILVDAEGRPKVLDFGVSRVQATGEGAPHGRTLTGQVIGTVDYMSPEQASGRPDIDTRADLYSLGVVGFELLSGRLPRGLSRLPLVDALRRVRLEPPPRLGELEPRFRGDVSLIFEQALQLEPDRRYASAAALAEDVRRFLAHEPILARPTTVTYQLRRFVKRHAAVVTLSGLAVLSLVLGLVLALAARAEEAEQRALAEQEAVRSRSAAYAARIQAAALALRTMDSQSVHRKLEATSPGARGWEWRYLWNRLNQDLAFHPQPLLDRPVPVFAPDAGWVAAHTDERTVRRFDFGAGAWGTPIVVPFRARALGTSGDGAHLLLADDQRLWACEPSVADEPRQVLTAPAPIYAMRPVPGRDEVALLCATDERSHLRFVRPGDWQVVRSLEVPQRMTGLDFDASARRVALWYPTRVQVWDLREERLLVERPFTSEGVAISSLGTQLAHWRLGSFGRDPVGSGASGWSVSLVDDHARRVRFASGDRWLVSAHLDATLRFWDAEHGTCLGLSSGASVTEGALIDFAYTPSRERIHAVGLDGAYVRVARHDPMPRVLSHGRTPYPYVYGVSFAPQGRRLVSTGWDGTARLWDVATGRALAVLEHDDVKVEWAAFSTDGRRLLTGARLGLRDRARLYLWDAWTGDRLTTLDSEPLCPSGVGGPGNGWTVGIGDEVCVLDGRTLAVRRRARVPGSSVRSLARHPDGSRVACATDVACVILRADSLERVHAFEGGGVSLAFGPDGQRLAVGGSDGTLAIRDLAGARRDLRVTVLRPRRVGEVPPVTAAQGAADIYAVAFTGGGRRVACGTRMGAILLFDAESGDEVLRLLGHGAYTHDLALHPRGEILASASGDGTVRLWDARPVAERLRAEEQVLAAEEAARERVEELIAQHGSREAVARALADDPVASALERHAAGNLLLRR